MKSSNANEKYRSRLIIILLSIVVMGTFLFSINMTRAKYVITSFNTVAFSSSSTFNVTAIGLISGTQMVTQVLTVGTITPTSAAASASYQWLRSSDSGVTFSAIANATLPSYTLTTDDLNCYITVTATGAGSYTGSVTSAAVGPILSPPTTPLIAIGAISGTAQLSNVLTAGSVTPAGATYTYQWQSSSDNNSFSDIGGAISITYTPVAADYSHYLRVTAIGTGSYSGTVVSLGIGKVTSVAVTAVAAPTTPSGTYISGNTLTCGDTTPANASVTYVWQRSSSSATSGFTAISGATSGAYTIAPTDYGYYIRVVVTGISTKGYTGSATSPSVGKVPTPLTSIGAFTGTMKVGNVVTCSTAVAPTGATYTYQWQSSTDNSTFSNISGANAKTYTLTGSEHKDYIRVAITGSGNYCGTVTSAAKQCTTALALTSVTLSTTAPKIGTTITATVAPLPSPATAVTYQWYRGKTTSSITTIITDATSSSYTLTSADLNYYIKVIVTPVANSGYTTTVNARTTSKATTGTLTSVSISGIRQVGQTLTASVIPSDATVTYTWYSSKYPEADGTYTTSLGTGSTYTVTNNNFDYYIRVEAVASGSYTGTVDSAGVQITMPLASLGLIGGTLIVGNTLTCGSILPSTATVTYQWQRSADNSTFADISGAILNTYVVTGDDVTGYVRVAVTGSGYYSGTLYSASSAAISLTSVSISGTVQTGQTLTTTVAPVGAGASYQWMKCSASGGTYTAISGAISSTYTLTASEYNCYIMVQATGNNDVSVTSSATAAAVSAGLVSAVTITGSGTVGSTLTAALTSPDPNVTYTYTWQGANSGRTTYTTVQTGTSSTLLFTQTIWSTAYYIRCIVTTSSTAYTGSSTSNEISTP